MNVPSNILHRPLTAESIKRLRETLSSAVTEMLIDSCPCHYPRFRYLTEFQHERYNAGPVFCADANYLIWVAQEKDLGFLTETDRITENLVGDYGADLVYTCRRCSTTYRSIGKQYNINFEFVYLIPLEKKYGADAGAAVTFPIPLLQGLYGFHENDILLCAKEYTLGSPDEVFNYLTAKK
jgi:hypothetical protein